MGGQRGLDRHPTGSAVEKHTARRQRMKVLTFVREVPGHQGACSHPDEEEPVHTEKYIS